VDDTDKAQHAADAYQDDALERQRRQAAKDAKAAEKNPLRPRGECLNPGCAEPFAADQAARLFCGPACAQVYAKYRKLNP
jgi:hypothetical protein